MEIKKKFIYENPFGIVVCEMAVSLSRPRCANKSRVFDGL